MQGFITVSVAMNSSRTSSMGRRRFVLSLAVSVCGCLVQTPVRALAAEVPRRSKFPGDPGILERAVPVRDPLVECGKRGNAVCLLRGWSGTPLCELDKIGMIFWKSCDGAHSASDISAIIRDRCRIPYLEAHVQCLFLLNTLHRRGAVRLSHVE